ncbi:hypothetical protein M33023_02510 [Candidatus Phytoplasma asteris]|uniref:Sequence-variable mosaic (SVM) signal sequence domain-containing protein n=2 Tax=Candidatus Phytoplasma asteris TaxID=85620 RepID=A0ABZ2YHE4_9MOLU
MKITSLINFNQFKKKSFLLLFLLLFVHFIYNTKNFVKAMETRQNENSKNIIHLNLNDELQESEIFQFNNAFNDIDGLNKTLKKFKIKLNNELNINSLSEIKEKFNGFRMNFFIKLNFLWYIYSKHENHAHILYTNYASDVDNMGNLFLVPSFQRNHYISLGDKIKLIDDTFMMQNNDRIEIYRNSFDAKNQRENTLECINSIYSDNLFQIFLDFDIKEEHDGLYMYFNLYKHGFTELNNYCFKIDFSLDRKIDFIKNII